jgi:hypothetical protein
LDAGRGLAAKEIPKIVSGDRTEIRTPVLLLFGQLDDSVDVRRRDRVPVALEPLVNALVGHTEGICQHVDVAEAARFVPQIGQGSSEDIVERAAIAALPSLSASGFAAAENV